MIAFFGIFLVSLVAAIGLAAGINYFFRIGLWPSLGFAILGIAAFLLFCVSGLWADAHRNDWGSLTPAFALILIAIFLAAKFGKRLWAWWQKKLKEMLG